MESNIVDEFKNLQVLAAYDFFKMDALVQDLTNALEESSRPKGKSKSKQSVDAAGGSGKKIKRKSKKRKTKSGSVMLWEQGNMTEASESSLDEALKDYMENIAQQQSDSDEVIRNAIKLPSLATLAAAANPVCSLAESDSVNENCSPMRPHRRRRRFKRMAVDPQSEETLRELVSQDHGTIKYRPLKATASGEVTAFEIDIGNIDLANTGLGRAVSQGILQEIKPGKRKRSMKEKGQGSSFDMDGMTEDSICSGEGSSQNSQGMEVATNCESSSNAPSSSESDGIYTNDEARDGDDEQSDFFHEPGPACGIPGIVPWWDTDTANCPNPAKTFDQDFEKILTGSFQHLSPASQRNFKARLKMMAKPGREYRSGRRTLKDRSPAYSMHCFLQDRQHWRDSAKRYHNTGGVGPSRHNNSSNNNTNGSTSCESKRRRKTPPNTPSEEGEYVGDKAAPIPDTNVGNRLLQSMGWMPGSGLGVDGGGITTPIFAFRRPSRQGLGIAPQGNPMGIAAQAPQPTSTSAIANS